MRTTAYENFYQKLIATTKCLDVNDIEKYISRNTSNDIYLINKQINKANKLLNERYERYGVITEQDNIDAFRKGYYDLGKIALTLDGIRKKIARFEIEKDSPIGMQINKDWNNAAFLLQDLLQLENMNLITYIRLLEERSAEISDSKVRKEGSSCHNEKKKDLQSNFINKSLMNIPSDVITIEETCELTRLSKSKIYHMVCDREIPHYKLNPNKKGRLYFSRSEIEAWLKRNRIGTTEEFCHQFGN